LPGKLKTHTYLSNRDWRHGSNHSHRTLKLWALH